MANCRQIEGGDSGTPRLSGTAKAGFVGGTVQHRTLQKVGALHLEDCSRFAGARALHNRGVIPVVVASIVFNKSQEVLIQRRDTSASVRSFETAYDASETI